VFRTFAPLMIQKSKNPIYPNAFGHLTVHTLCFGRNRGNCTVVGRFSFEYVEQEIVLHFKESRLGAIVLAVAHDCVKYGRRLRPCKLKIGLRVPPSRPGPDLDILGKPVTDQKSRCAT
jgi:hypothetical protein